MGKNGGRRSKGEGGKGWGGRERRRWGGEEGEVEGRDSEAGKGG